MLTLKKIWRYFCYLTFARKTWCWPKQSDVLIYDAMRQEILLEYLKPWQPEVMHLRGEQINVRVLLKSLFRGGAKGLVYIDCYIEKVRPRLVVTFVDNDQQFYKLSGRYPGVKTLFIQNGMRGNDGPLETLDALDIEALKFNFVDHMLVFGECIGAKYKKLLRGEVVPMGAIVNNLARKEKLPRLGVMAYVSHWRLAQGVDIPGTCNSHEDFVEKPDRVVTQFLAHYARAKNKRLMIIPTYSKGSDLRSREEAYFGELMESEPEFVDLGGPYPSYHAVDAADIVVSIDSTLGYESIARGNKTAIFSIIDTFLLGASSRNYGWPGDFPDEGLFWTNRPDPNSFDRILDYLFEVDDAQWREDVRASNFSSIMAYDPGNTILKSTLENILGAPPTSEH